MEDLFGVFLAIIAFAISAASKSKKQQKKSAAAKAFEPIRAEQFEEPLEVELKPVAPAAAAKQVTNKPAAAQPETTLETHRHEGKQEIPCPADELRPSQRREEKPAAPSIPGLKLTFDRNSVVQGFVMSEILNRPRPGMRR